MVPERVWLDPDATPPGTGGEVPFAGSMLGILAGSAGALLLVLALKDGHQVPPPLGKHGLRIVDGCLWYGKDTTFGRGPRVRACRRSHGAGRPEHWWRARRRRWTGRGTAASTGTAAA